MASNSSTDKDPKKESSATTSMKPNGNNHMLNQSVNSNNGNNNNGNTKDGDSDNSGYSLGINSFGFNFDSEEGMTGPSPSNSDSGAKSDEDAATGGVTGSGTGAGVGAGANASIRTGTNGSATIATSSGGGGHGPSHPQTIHPSLAVTGNVNVNVNPMNNQPPATAAATPASVNINRPPSGAVSGSVPTSGVVNVTMGQVHPGTKQGIKRKASDTGYKSDDEASNKGNVGNRNVSATVSIGGSSRSSAPSTITHANYAPSSITVSSQATQLPQAQAVQPISVPSCPPSSVAPKPATVQAPVSNAAMTKREKKKVTDEKREERNLREKERSYRITSQINELRNLLSSGGVIVPKGTKNAVLTEAANYIRALQQHQYNSELHRQQLIKQMQVIASGQLGPQAANAISHVAANNGVWSLLGKGGMPPRSAMVPAIGAPQKSQQQGLLDVNGSLATAPQAKRKAPKDGLLKDIEDTDYRFVFNSCAIAMAIASMGGAFIDCNQLFIQLSEYTKQEICGLTVFNMTAREDLQSAFDLISRMISPPADSPANATHTCTLRGNMKHRTDLGLSITLIKDGEGIAKCFCVSLIRNPLSAYDDTPPVHATAALVRHKDSNGNYITQEVLNNSGLNADGSVKAENLSSPAFMTG